MITLRTLKKHSKAALPILLRHYPRALEEEGEVFFAEKGENYHGLVIRCTHGAGDPCRVEGRPRCACTWHPLKGTPMVGAVKGYYEPEWDEKTALEALMNAVTWHDRPVTMTDTEWRRALKITGARPATDDDMKGWFSDGEDDDALPAEPAAQEDQPR